MHVALASRDDDTAFAPEPFTPFYLRGLFQSMRTQALQSFQRLRKQRSKLPESFQSDVAAVLELEPTVVGRFRALVDLKVAALRIRTHGDYHLGQVLYTGKDFVIIDFEGEPDRPVSERRIKRSPLRDVAGMIRSFDYAAYAALLGQIRGVEIPPERMETTDGWLRLWYTWVSAVFLRSYLDITRQAAFLPKTREELETLLNAYVLEKLMYELGYELNNRPDWARIPMQGILRLAET
jgi:maltose alpha-D-glucosyltransferase/alpha-amylase